MSLGSSSSSHSSLTSGSSFSSSSSSHSSSRYSQSIASSQEMESTQYNHQLNARRTRRMLVDIQTLLQSVSKEMKERTSKSKLMKYKFDD